MFRVRRPEIARFAITAAVVLILFARHGGVHAADLFLRHQNACLARLAIHRHQVASVVQVGHAQPIRRPLHPARRIGSETGIGKDRRNRQRLRLCPKHSSRRDKHAKRECANRNRRAPRTTPTTRYVFVAGNDGSVYRTAQASEGRWTQIAGEAGTPGAHRRLGIVPGELRITRSPRRLNNLPGECRMSGIVSNSDNRQQTDLSAVIIRLSIGACISTWSRPPQDDRFTRQSA